VRDTAGCEGERTSVRNPAGSVSMRSSIQDRIVGTMVLDELFEVCRRAGVVT
jgi:hypothetical protein